MNKIRICPLSGKKKFTCPQTESCNLCPFYIDKTCKGCSVNLEYIVAEQQ